jgi:hypothetical protein
MSARQTHNRPKAIGLTVAMLGVFNSVAGLAAAIEPDPPITCTSGEDALVKV